MIRLTFDGVNDLYQHPRWGAVTVEHAAYLDTLKSKPTPPLPKIIQMSEELARREERCIDEYGCSSFIH